jgi:hypothetical protein
LCAPDLKKFRINGYKLYFSSGRKPPALVTNFIFQKAKLPSLFSGFFANSGYKLYFMITLLRLNSPGIISLLNGTNNAGAVLATGGGLPGARDSWQNYSASFTTGASVSGDLTIALSVVGNGTTVQADFDNVQVTTTPVLKAPILSAAKISGSNLILSGMP